MEIVYQKIQDLQSRFRFVTNAIALPRYISTTQLVTSIKSIGYATDMGEYTRRKLGIFNLLNFFQLVSGILIPIAGMLHHDAIPNSAWLMSCLPTCTSIVVLVLTHNRNYTSAVLTYFLAYPFLTCLVYFNGMNAGTSLNFILYGILSVFFLKDIGYMLFSIGLSMVSYFVLSVILKDFLYEVRQENYAIYLINHLLTILFIFYGLYLIKKENAQYQFRLIAKNRALHRKNLEIRTQKETIAEKANELKLQKSELVELNTLKNRLFSVISHDLKSPMYALRNLFQNMQQYDLPAEEVKQMVPDVLNDLNYTISLMENLLQWSKSQMRADSVQLQEVNISELIADVLKLLRLQAEAKQLHIEHKTEKPVIVFADRDMINLVLRNLLSNAIKFTPEKGSIQVGVNDLSCFAEIYVQDSGMGISREDLKKINENNFYTTKGTASESGTGLGLMLCREFLARNGGQMHIESEPGKGSVFSFTLPISGEN